MTRLSPRPLATATAAALHIPGAASLVSVDSALRALPAQGYEPPAPPEIQFECPPGYQLTAAAKDRMQQMVTAPDNAAMRRLLRRFEQDPCPVFEPIQPVVE